MRWLPLTVAAVVLVAGFARVTFESGPAGAITADTARKIASCLRGSKEIPANTRIDLVPLPQEAADKAKLGRVEKLEFVATGPVRVELAPDELSEVEKNGATTLSEARSFTIDKSAGPFEFELQPGSGSEAVVLRRDDIQFLLQLPQSVRFSPADNVSYRITLKDPHAQIASKVENGKNVPVLRVGERATLELGAGQTFVSIQPISPSFWLVDAPPRLVTTREFGQGGQADLAVEARQSGIGFAEPGFDLRGCVFPRQTPEAGWKPVGVVETKAHEAGAATVRLSLPAGIVPNWGLMVPIDLVVVSSDGRYVGYGGLTTIGRALSVLIATILTLALFLWLANLRADVAPASATSPAAKGAPAEARFGHFREDPSGWFAGLFIGPDQDPSLSLFQIFFWTVITVWGLIYVFLVTGSLLGVTQSMMGLLGIAGSGSVLARWISSSTPGGSTSQPPGAETGTKDRFSFWQMLRTGGNFDLLKLQLLVFTLMIGAYVVWRIADSGVFPELDGNTLLLLGVSQGIYIGGKVAGTSALSRLQAIKLQLDVAQAARKDLPADRAALEEKLKNVQGAKNNLKAGDRLNSDQEKDLNDLPKEIDKLKELDEQIAKLQKDYDVALKELGPKGASG